MGRWILGFSVLVILFVVFGCKAPSSPAPTPVPVNPISTVAGNGTRDFSGDGGPSTSAELDFPSAVAADGASDLFIGDSNNDVVREVGTAGTIATVAGTGETATTTGNLGDGAAATSATLNSPLGLAVDPTGNLFIADSGNNLIREVTAATKDISTVTVTVAGGAASLWTPTDVVVDSTGGLYIADSKNNRVVYVTSGGAATTFAGNAAGSQGWTGDGGPATSAFLSDPYGLALDPSGNLYIADLGNNCIRKVSGGTITTVAGTCGPGNNGYSGDGAVATAAKLTNPKGVAVDSSGNLFISDSGNNVIRKVTAATGFISTYAGTGTAGSSGDGGAAASAELDDPAGIIVTSAGVVYFADSENNRVRRIGP